MHNRRRKPVDDRVIEVIKGDLYRHFMMIFEYTHRITGEIPLQPGNEIRIAFNHVSRAFQEKIDEKEIIRNIDNAKAHIISATMDCFMISIINRLDFLSNFIEGLKT